MNTKFTGRYTPADSKELSLEEYLAECRHNPLAYATSAERMLRAIGEPQTVDISTDARLSRIHNGSTMTIYPAFTDMYGMQGAIAEVVAYFRHAAQWLEERKQILYLMGPVGGGKSSLAERLKQLAEKTPFYAVKGSPVNESPLGLFPTEDARILHREYGIPLRYLENRVMSPWAVKRLEEYGGDIRRFRVVKRFPSILKQIGISKVEPGDENNQDISSLVGKVDIRKLEKFGQDDPDAYSYSGGLCLANQGLLEFVEMFKAPIKVLHPLLTATQEGNYKGTEGFGAIPFDGTVLAHSNESEWKAFRNNKNNEAFLDRICIVKVPYILSVTDEVKVYQKMLANSSISTAHCAPKTLEFLAEACVLSRLVHPGPGSSLLSKMLVYDGEMMRGTDPKAKEYQAYREVAGVNEGMTGLSPRFAFKVFSKTLNFHAVKVEADPMHLMQVLDAHILQEQFPAETEDRYVHFVQDILTPRYCAFLGREIRSAYLESHVAYGQSLFDTYVEHAYHWQQKKEFVADDGELLTRELLEEKLSDIERVSRIPNPKDFRNEVVSYVSRMRPQHGGKNPAWTSYQKIRGVIENKIFLDIDEMLPVITAGSKMMPHDQDKHDGFLGRMMARGYTQCQVRMLCDWYLRVRKTLEDIEE